LANSPAGIATATNVSEKKASIMAAAPSVTPRLLVAYRVKRVSTAL
jgi:hypothetical protein